MSQFVADAIQLRHASAIDVALLDDVVRVVEDGSPGATYSRQPDPATSTYETAARGLQLLAFLYRDVTIELHDDRSTPEHEATDEILSDVGAAPPIRTLPLGRRHVFSYDDGLVGLVRHLNRTKSPLHPSIIHIRDMHDGVTVEVAMQWNAGYSESLRSFVNGVPTPDGNAYEDALLGAVSAAISTHGRQRRMRVPPLDAGDCAEGLAAAIAINNPNYSPVARVVELVCQRELTDWFAAQPDEDAVIVRKARTAHKQRRTPRTSRCACPDHLPNPLQQPATP